MTTSLTAVAERAKTLRRHIITSTTTAASGHPTSSLSATDLVAALYFGGFLRHDPKDPRAPGRDRFILSKGHAAPLLYAAMAEAGYFPPAELASLRRIGSPLEGHPNVRRLPGIEASTGSLGQGLSIGLGHALATRLDGLSSRVFVLLGDGEVGEGQVWEAVMAAAKYRATNLVAMVDANGYQQTGATKDVLDLQPLAPKFEAFGWQAMTINGHDLAEVLKALEWACAATSAPRAIVARTIKGYPLHEFLKSDPNHHGKPLTPAEAEQALALLA